MLDFHTYLLPPLRTLPWRPHPLDGKLLLFERDMGLNLLMEGEETAHLQRTAPRTLLIAVTNGCDLTCSFCYRDRTARSLWRYDTLLAFCQAADEWGVLEVAFGGGEPLLFPRWTDFINELYGSTRLAINFTTNGTHLTEEVLQAIAGRYGHIRLSLYDTNDWAATIARLVRCRARFGVNWLITPAELPTIEAKFTHLLRIGVRDFLLISYKGDSEPHLHCSADDCRRLAAFVNQVYARLGNAVQIKLDSCWGARLPDVPRLFATADCGAGDEYVSITSDRQLKPCSFAPYGTPIGSVDEVKAYWQQQRLRRQAAEIGGCARLSDYGLTTKGKHGETIPLAAVQQQP